MHTVCFLGWQHAVWYAHTQHIRLHHVIIQKTIKYIRTYNGHYKEVHTSRPLVWTIINLLFLSVSLLLDERPKKNKYHTSHNVTLITYALRHQKDKLTSLLLPEVLLSIDLGHTVSLFPEPMNPVQRDLHLIAKHINLIIIICTSHFPATYTDLHV